MMKPFVGTLAVCIALTGASLSRAEMATQKQAKAAGVPAANCLYCHNEKIPAKGKSTNNERGKWLVAQKEVKKAKVVDGAWLKDYVEPKK
jgi:hypothetical protein